MRRRDCLKLATAGSMSMLGLTGCLALIEEDGEESTPASMGPPQSTTTSTENKSEVPTVSNPLDVSGLKANICTALTSEQLQKLGLKSGERGSGKTGLVCQYEYGDDFSSQVTIQAVEKFKNGLADIYDKEEALGYFKEIEVAGYPAVFAGKYKDHRGRGYCQLYVGLTDTFVVRVIAQSGSATSDYDLPCVIVELITKIMIQNLKAASTGKTDSKLPEITSTESKSEVPTVTNPLDVSTLKTKPCTALSSEQLQKLGLTTDKRGSTPLSNFCVYDYTNESPNYVGIAVLKRFQNGLADVYAREAEFDYFKPTQLSGYPAAYGLPGDILDSKESECRLYVGLTDTFVVVLYTNLYKDTSDYGRPCDVVKLTAETMIQNLKDDS